jgi:hypothetical protein
MGFYRFLWDSIAFDDILWDFDGILWHCVNGFGYHWLVKGKTTTGNWLSTSNSWACGFTFW